MPDIRHAGDGEDDRVFKDFREYWHYTKSLDKNHRDLIFASLQQGQQDTLRASYRRGGWEDVIVRDTVNRAVDGIKKEFGYDMISVRCRVMAGKSVYMPRIVWEHFNQEMQKFSAEHALFVTGGIRAVACKQNADAVLIVRNDSPVEE